jgi:hypothetical protein
MHRQAFSHSLPLSPWRFTHFVKRSLLETYNEDLQARAISGSSSSASVTLISSALLLHASFFIVVLLLRRFSPSRALETQYLTLIFALTIPILALIFFLLNQRLSQQQLGLQQNGTSFALFFILDHAAIEFLLCLQVLLPTSTVKRRPGWILLGVWILLCLISVGASLSPSGRSVDVIAWTAFTSDVFLIVAGGILVFFWATRSQKEEAPKQDETPKIMIENWDWNRKKEGPIQRAGNPEKDAGGESKVWYRKVPVEGLAGLGFIVHGTFSLLIMSCCLLVAYY